MSIPQQLSWENFRSTVFVRGDQRVHRVTESPDIEVFGDGVSNRIGIWIEIPPGTLISTELSKLALIATRTFDKEGRHLLEVSTDAASLHRQFYHFAVAVAERVIVEKCPAPEAVTSELQCFTELLEEKSILGTERQIGLLGELIFLERLILKNGIGALDSWIGPLGEPHDFRIQDREFEVKTTLAPQRTHTIHGTEQLVPSSACLLYLVSVLLGPPGVGDGFSLSEKVVRLTEKFNSVPTLHGRFEAALEGCGFHDADRAHYSRRFAMRRPIGLVRIDSSFPAITRMTIQNVLGPLAPRIESLQYDVSVEGLENEDGTDEFNLALPS